MVAAPARNAAGGNVEHDSRQQRRRIVRELIKSGERTRKSGLDPRPPAASVLAVAHLIKAKLEERANRRRAGEAAQLVHDLFEASLRAFPPRVEIACRRGCNYCCHSFVAVLAPEVFRIAALLRTCRDPRLSPAAIAQKAAPLKGISVEGRIGAKLACPLLVDGDCGVYTSRPLVCRQATSLSVTACLDEFENPDPNDQIEISAAHVTHASNANVILMAALKAVGLSSDALELSEALTVALADSGSEEKWLAGEDVFAGVARHRSPTNGTALMAQRIARDLAT